MRIIYYLFEIAICQNCSMKNKFYNVAYFKKGLNMVKIHYISGDIIGKLRYHWSNFLSLRTGYIRSMFNNFCFDWGGGNENIFPLSKFIYQKEYNKFFFMF
jgi:hypothetical protein